MFVAGKVADKDPFIFFRKETVRLKKPDEVYLEIYKEVKRRAKEAKKKAIEAYLEAKRIKSLYLLDEIESSDDESELLEMTVN